MAVTRAAERLQKVTAVALPAVAGLAAALPADPWGVVAARLLQEEAHWPRLRMATSVQAN